MDLRTLALNAQFDERAVRFLLDEVQRIRTTVDGEIAGGRTPRSQRCRAGILGGRGAARRAGGGGSISTGSRPLATASKLGGEAGEARR